MSGSVECHSGYDYAERPTAFYWQGVRLQVAEIIRRWREPGQKCFQVYTEDKQIFDIRYEESEDLWLISQP